MRYQYEDKCTSEGKAVRVLASTFEPGVPVGKEDGKWRQKLGSRADELKYLKSAERYWYGESFGSEKRRKPA
jgi:hypothetical protein